MWQGDSRLRNLDLITIQTCFFIHISYHMPFWDLKYGVHVGTWLVCHNMKRIRAQTPSQLSRTRVGAATSPVQMPDIWQGNARLNSSVSKTPQNLLPYCYLIVTVLITATVTYCYCYLTVTVTLLWLLPYCACYLTVPVTLLCLLPYCDCYLTVTVTLLCLLPYCDCYLTVTVTLLWPLPYCDRYLTVPVTLLCLLPYCDCHLTVTVTLLLPWLLPYCDCYLTVTVTLPWLLPYCYRYLTMTVTLRILLPYCDRYLTVSVTLLLLYHYLTVTSLPGVSATRPALTNTHHHTDHTLTYFPSSHNAEGILCNFCQIKLTF